MAKEPKKKPSLEEFQNEIRMIAEENYRKRSDAGKSGDALSDWLQAEKEVKKKYRI